MKGIYWEVPHLLIIYQSDLYEFIFRVPVNHIIGPPLIQVQIDLQGLDIAGAMTVVPVGFLDPGADLLGRYVDLIAVVFQEGVKHGS